MFAAEISGVAYCRPERRNPLSRAVASPTDMFESLSGPATPIWHLANFVFGVTGVIFALVGCLIVIALVRFRRRKDDGAREPAQIYGSNRLETAWTVLPMLIVLVLALTGARVIQALQDRPRPAGALDVTVVGHQWWWEVRYPSLGIVTANELHVPVSDPRAPSPTWLELASADVAHSFWVPRLAGKTDLIPNRINHAWIAPDAPGLYLGQCAEFCGTQHALMLLRVYAHSREDFERWVKAQQAQPSTPPARTPGRRVFESTGCVNCHALGGTIANGRYGPDLTHLMSRETLASGAALNTPATLRQWLQKPETIKPGVHMPGMQLDDQDLDQLVAYLLTLK
jgi:cytochrome c oxidase subunit 2